MDKKIAIERNDLRAMIKDAQEKIDTIDAFRKCRMPGALLTVALLLPTGQPYAFLTTDMFSDTLEDVLAAGQIAARQVITHAKTRLAMSNEE